MTPRPARPPVHFRPSLETLEDRVVPAAPAMAPGTLLLDAALFGAFNNHNQEIPISFSSVANQNGQLVASGTIGHHSFSTTLTLSATPGPNNSTILDLDIAPIHLSVLGLNLNTSAICLDITTTSGSTDPLGSLLNSIATSLNSGNSLSSVLAGLNSSQLSTLNSGLTTLLNDIGADLTAKSSVSSPTTANLPSGSTDILHLSLGPVNVNLLGLNIALNNCATPPGPITLDLSSQSGGSNLLGTVFTDLDHLLTPFLGQTNTDQLLTDVADGIIKI
jgi:hypothetical protein